MTDHTVLVSVIVPTYYRNDRLVAALRSIRAQTHDPIEVVVVDDSGEGHAREAVAEHPNVTYVAHETNRGAHAARDTGLAHVDGDYVQFLDDDDTLAPEKFTKQVALLEERPDVGVAYCGLAYEDGRTHHPDPAVRGDVLEAALRFYDHPLTTSTMLVDSDVLSAVRPLDRSSPGADDIGMAIELAGRTRFDFVDEVFVTGGRPPETRGTGWGGVDGRWRILERYADLYDEAPADVRRAAVAETYRLQGRRYLEDRPWSAAAVYSFAQGLRYEPTVTIAHVGEFLASLGGRLGWRLARWTRGILR